MPLVNNFTMKMRDSITWLENNGRRDEINAIDAVFAFRQKAASSAYYITLDLENIEELFSLASMGNENYSSHMQHAIAATLDFCSSTRPNNTIECPEHHFRFFETIKDSVLHTPGDRFTFDRYAYYIAKLLGMFRDEKKPKGRNTFISLNYDMLIEHALERLQQKFSYGFEGKQIQGTCKNHDSGADILLLKLHGSINWFYPQKKGFAGKLALRDSYEAVRAERKAPAIIPPTWRKQAHGGGMTGLWSHAIEQLRTATNIIVMGYSLPITDMYVKYLLATGLQQNISLRRIVFVNKGPEIEERVHSLFGQHSRNRNLVEINQGYMEQFTHADAMLGSLGRPVSDLGLRVIVN